MASAQFDGGKKKGNQEAKGLIDHILRNHENYSNQDIQPELSYKNYYSTSPEDAWQHYKRRIDEIKAQSSKRLRKDCVTLHGVNIPIPDGIPVDEYVRFAHEIYKIFEGIVGHENVILYSLHCDEIHDYVSMCTNTLVTSKAHIHCAVIPWIVEKQKLCDKEFSSIKTFNTVNKAIDKLCREKYHCSFLTGEFDKNRKYKSVEQLKIESARAAANLEREATMRKNEAIFEENFEYIEIDRRLDKACQEISEKEEQIQKLKDEESIIKSKLIKLRELLNHCLTVLKKYRPEIQKSMQKELQEQINIDKEHEAYR